MTQTLRLFAASPGDVPSERSSLEKVVDEVNQTHGDPLGYRLELLRWETHATPGAGRPQATINEAIGSYDLFIGIMWRRFGTPTGVAESGTEEEFSIAYDAWKKKHLVDLFFYFCQKPFMPRTAEELEQMQKVLAFRKRLEGLALVWDYPTAEEFPDAIRKHLCMRINRLLRDPGPRAAAAGVREKADNCATTQPDNDTIQNLKTLWDRMEPSLQAAFSVAYNDNRRTGDPGIKTRDLFAALQRLRPEALQPILDELPPPSLPAPTEGHIMEQPYIMLERPWLSHCVASSIARLKDQLPPGRLLTAADVFADIAKNGSGESVRMLRENKIGPAEIEAIFAKHNIKTLGSPV